MWLAGIDFNAVVSGKGHRIEPAAVRQECVAAKEGDGGLEMEAARHSHGDDLVTLGQENRGELVDAFGVAALGDTNEKLAADAQNVAALERAGKRDVLQFAKFGNGLLERGGFGA